MNFKAFAIGFTTMDSVITGVSAAKRGIIHAVKAPVHGAQASVQAAKNGVLATSEVVTSFLAGAKQAIKYRKEMEAIEDPAERQKYYEAMVAKMYENGKALSVATVLEIDEVIDPMRTREWVLAGLRSVPRPAPREGKKRPCIDAF